MADFERAITASDLPPGEVTKADVGGRQIAIANVDGSFYAIDDLCPHAGGSLGDGHLSDGCVACPLHYWEFDVRSGEFIDDPTTKVATHETKVEGDDVLVKLTD